MLRTMEKMLQAYEACSRKAKRLFAAASSLMSEADPLTALEEAVMWLKVDPMVAHWPGKDALPECRESWQDYVLSDFPLPHGWSARRDREVDGGWVLEGPKGVAKCRDKLQAWKMAWEGCGSPRPCPISRLVSGDVAVAPVGEGLAVVHVVGGVLSWRSLCGSEVDVADPPAVAIVLATGVTPERFGDVIRSWSCPPTPPRSVPTRPAGAWPASTRPSRVVDDSELRSVLEATPGKAKLGKLIRGKFGTS